MDMQKIKLVFDGGSKGNPGVGFGSFQITEGWKKPRAPVRLRFGRVTNNDAEYLTLISALTTLIEELRVRRISPKEIRLDIRGDSQLVINQISGSWKAKNSRMRDYRNQVQRITARFGGVTSTHHKREVSYHALGH